MSRIQELITQTAERTAEAVNGSISHFLALGSEALEDSPLPLMQLVQIIQKRENRPIHSYLVQQFPWVSGADIAVATHFSRLDAEEDYVRLTRELEMELHLIQSHFFAILHLPPYEVLPEVLFRLNPHALLEFERFFIWQVQTSDFSSDEIVTRHLLFEQAWSTHCANAGAQWNREGGNWRESYLAYAKGRLMDLPWNDSTLHERFRLLLLHLDSIEK